LAASKRKSAARKAAKTGKPRSAAKKPAKTRKPRAAAKKAAKTGKPRVAAKKAAPTRKPGAADKAPTVRTVSVKAPPVTAEIDNRISIVRANLRDLVEQAASSAGAGSEELLSQRITQQEERLRLLTKERDELLQRGS